MAQSERREGKSIGDASMWMLGLTLLLFWLPGLGPFIAGFVGGRKAGGVGPAIVAALMPAFLLAIAVIVLATLGMMPFAGILAGSVLFIAVAASSLPLIAGAVAGALTG
ncbi:MAG: hypothetical protein HY331_13995 [Chloroflexi bacterium]|nr:hypothetical protein [Chloroflexota bacterium]